MKQKFLLAPAIINLVLFAKRTPDFQEAKVCPIPFCSKFLISKKLNTYWQ